MITSKISSKAQTTIPQSVRVALGLQAGDSVGYAIESDRVILTRISARKEGDDPFVTFSEWDSPEDMKAYRDL